MAGTNKPKLDEHWKTSKPGSLTSGFTNSPEFIEAYRHKLLESLMKLRKKCLTRIILWWMRVEWKNLTLLVPLSFHLAGCRWKNIKLFMFIHKGLFTCRWRTSGRWGTPPYWGRFHRYLRRSLRDRKHQEAEIRLCNKTWILGSWDPARIYFLFCL